MIWPQLQMIAQVSIERMLNSLPEELMIVLFAWGMLRLFGRQNSRTRFAIWFFALVAVVGLPFAGGLVEGRSLLTAGGVAPITIPGRWAAFIFGAWAVLASVAVLRLGAGVWRLRELRKSCVPIKIADMDPAVRKTIAEFSAARAVTITTSENVRVPAAIGFFNPIIVIPAWTLHELTPDELNIILVHEYAHLRHWDDWTNLFQKIVRAVFILHPAVWWIERRMSLEREMACDDVVLAETGNPRGYAQCLIAMLERNCKPRVWAMAQAVVHQAREASLRLAQILDKRRPAATQVWKPALGLMGVFAIVCVAVTLLTPRLVAFGPSATANSVAKVVEPPELGPTEVPVARVVPAAIHTSAFSPAPLVQKRSERNVARHGVQPTEARAFSAGLKDEEPNRLAPLNTRIANAGAVNAKKMDAKVVDANVEEQAQTLVFVQATEYRHADAVVWSVRVWQVIYVNPPQNRVPAASSL